MDYEQDNSTIDKIAIIGMAGRFPGANTIDELWENLCQAKETVTFFSEDELDPEVGKELIEDPKYVRARGIIEDADKFDADFFGMTPREAEIMDPQNRILLELAWETFENAGYDPKNYDGLIGVFAGAGFNSYFVNNVLTRPELVDMLGRHQVEIANGPDYLATRVSYKFDLKGPSISLYTGCSSSLVAVFYGVESLLGYQCDMALAGGVFVATPLKSGYLYQEGEMLSPDGHTRPFDADAGGTVFSSGAGLVLLKRLEDAIEDGDHIYALIRGAALNNDGSDKVSFTAPSVEGQAQVVAMAQANSGVTPDMVSYVETHGTATPVGDPIEIEALSQAFKSRTKNSRYCPVGSIKGNIGHLDAAAGIAGLIKTSLALYNEKIPPSINFNKPNPVIDFENSPFYVNTSLLDWESNGLPRIAGVSSFGVGGTNAHVILEEAPQKNDAIAMNRWHLLPISAKNEHALEAATRRLVEFLEETPNNDLGNVVQTLQHGRRVFNCRRVAVCKDVDHAKKVLDGLVPQLLVTSSSIRKERDIVFMFSGQDAQYVGMGRNLYRNNVVFRDKIDKCSEILKSSLQLDLRDILYPSDDGIEEVSDLINETYLTQPALFTIEYALARVWESMGIAPTAFVGHSIGEYVAACLAGVFTLEDALRLVALRGKLIQGCPKGLMLAVFLPEDKVQPLLRDGISLAAVNAPQLCVVSGAIKQVEELENELTAENITCRRLHTSHAFHSAMMDSVKDEFIDEVQKIKRNEPSIPYLSNVTGTWIRPDEATDPNYWGTHIRQTVRFSECVEELLKKENRILLEVGPGNTLCSLAAQHTAAANNHVVLSTLRHVKEKIDDEAFLLKSFGHIWTSGQNIDWAKLASNSHHRIPLPTYPFEKKRHWVVPKKLLYRNHLMEGADQNADTEGAAVGDESQPEVVDTQKAHEGNEIESKVTQIWKKVLGYQNIDLDDNYFELGGSSLMAVRVFNQIEKVLGKRLPLATLYEAPTIRSMSELISREDYRPSWASLIKIQTGYENKPPIFCMHAEGGNVLEYYALAKHLGKDQPFYGLQAIGLDGKKVVAPTIEEMASHFIKEIKTVQPQGPYFIGGYCLGGLVAHEMAGQLLEMGEEIAFLFLISTSTPDHLRKKVGKLNRFSKLYYRILDRVDLELNNISFLGPRNKVKYLHERLIRTLIIMEVRLEDYLTTALGKLAINIKNHSRVYILQKSVDFSDEAYMSYKPKPINQKMVLCCVENRSRSHPSDSYLGWKNIAKERIELHEVKGFHKNILKEPNVLALAEKLKYCLEEAQENQNKVLNS